MAETLAAVGTWMATTFGTTAAPAAVASDFALAAVPGATLAAPAAVAAPAAAGFSLTAGDVLVGGAGAFGAMSALSAAQATAQAAAFNAAQLKRGAEREKAIAEMEAASYRRNQLARLALARTELAGGGRDMTGTAIKLDEQAVEDIAYEEAVIRAGGHLAGQELTEQAQLQRASGSFARRAGLLRAGTTLASAGSRLSALQNNFFG